MTETQMLAALVASLFGLLSVIVGWLGSRVIVRLDTLADKMDGVKSELHSRVNGLDNRLVKVETLASKNERAVSNAVFR